MNNLGFHPKRKRFWLASILGISILFYTIHQANLARLFQGFEEIDWMWGSLVIASSASSYLFIAAVLHLLLKNIGYPLTFSKTFRISTVSCTLNYLMACGGLSGVAAKVYMLSREDIPPSKTLSVSMIHGFLTNTIAIVLIYLGFFFLYSSHKLGLQELEVGVIVLLLAFFLTWLTIQIIVNESFRKKLWNLCMRVTRFACNRIGHPGWIHEEKAEAFFSNFDEGMKLLVRNSRNLLGPALFALLDWVFMFLCLAWSFRAVNYEVNTKILLVGFSVAIFASLFSITPAGVGVMEGSMTGSFYLMGLDYDKTLLAVLLYRFFYYIFPLILSFLFYHQLFGSSRRMTKGAA